MEMIMIKDAAKHLGVESHVLRYWEEELGLEIKRNTMGHRYYDERDIRMFEEVKDLRDRGFSLKDIKEGIERQKEALKEEQKEGLLKSQNKVDSVEIPVKKVNINVDDNKEMKIVDFKMVQMQSLMNKIMANALRENKDIITSSIKTEVTADVMRQFDTVMREKEEKEENRYKRLDEVLRQVQRSNEEVAATRTKGKWFKKKKD